MKFFPASRYASSLALLIFPLCAGCGTGGYDELVEARLANLQSLAPFTTRVGNIKYDIPFKEAESLEKTGMTMYVPKSFDDKEMIELTIGGKDPFTKTLFEPKRVNPPFYTFPGYSKGLECFIETANGYKQPMYAYWATRQLSTISGSKLRAEVAKGIGTGLSVKAPTWQAISVGAMGGKGLEVHRLQVAGKQDFYCLRNSTYAEENLDGRFDLYHLEGPEYHLLVGFRAPDAADEKTDFFACAQVAMGTLQGEGITFVDEFEPASSDLPQVEPEAETPATDPPKGESPTPETTDATQPPPADTTGQETP